MPDPRSQHKSILLTGKLTTNEPATIGDNFRSLKNLRYTDTHLRGIQGMSEIGGVNVTDTDTWGTSDTWGSSDAWGDNPTYFITRNVVHFVKSQPSETHILTQRFSGSLNTSVILDNTTAIPGTGDFGDTIVLGAAGNTTGYFSDAPDGKVIFCNGIDTHIWGGVESKCGAFITSTAAIADGGAATTPVDYSDVITNTKDDALNVATIGGTALFFLVGSLLPGQTAIKMYVKSANTTAGTMTGKYWNGSAWTAMTVTDNTAAGGKTLAKTGTVTFATTETIAKPVYLEGYYLYWYQFTITDGDATVSRVTLNSSFQKIVDMWDGVYRDVMRFFKRTTTYLDNTTNVLKDDYYSTDATTYADLSSLGAYSDPANCLEIGFSEKQTALYFNIPAEYTNSTAATTANVDYWTGAAYTTVGTITDGTSEGSIAFAKPGIISWNNSAYSTETTKMVSNSPPLYFYRVRFDKAMDASVRVNYVGGITAQKEITYFKFPVFAQGRVLLCADMSESKNKIICSGKYTPQVYNGIDSVEIYFGEEGELTCGTGLFSQFGSSLYALVLMFKDNETWVMAGQDITEWGDNTFLLSSSIGCPAPLTLKVINLHAEPGAGINRTLAIWQGASGIYMSDGRAPIPIHGDIAAYFDKADSRCINATMVGSSVGEIDPVNQTYHWLFASGSSAASLNKELVYDIKRNKWFEIYRGIDNPLQFVLLVHDTNGNAYNYGFLDNGKMYRLENGTTFDGKDIEHEFHTGDIPLGGLGIETQIDKMRLITVAKTTTTNNIALTHYGDMKTIGTSKTMSPARSGYRVAQPLVNEKLGAFFHSFKVQMTTDDETIGFEPIALVVTHHLTHQD